MATTEERLAALEAKLAQLTATTPTEYYTHQYSGEEIDAAVGRAVTGGALDTSVSNVSNQLGTFVRPNLLDNWYFGNPVNQMGGTEWLSSSSSAIPCVDRWTWWGQYITGTRLNLLDDGLQLAKPAEGQGQGLYQAIIQKVEKTRVPVGATVTLSALVKAEADASVVLAINDSYNVLSVQANVWELITFTVNAPSVEQTYSVSIQRNSGGIAFTVKAAKLELGPTQTLAHREGDKWVLNEAPDYGEQLRRCLRYCRVDDFTDSYTVAAFGVAVSETYWRGFLPSYSDMRTKPTIAIIGDNPSVQLIGNGQSINIAGLVPTVISAKMTGTAIGFNGVSGLVANQTYALQLYRCKIIRSADL